MSLILIISISIIFSVFNLFSIFLLKYQIRKSNEMINVILNFEKRIGKHYDTKK